MIYIFYMICELLQKKKTKFNQWVTVPQFVCSRKQINYLSPFNYPTCKTSLLDDDSDIGNAD